MIYLTLNKTIRHHCKQMLSRWHLLSIGGNLAIPTTNVNVMRGNFLNNRDNNNNGNGSNQTMEMFSSVRGNVLFSAPPNRINIKGMSGRSG